MDDKNRKQKYITIHCHFYQPPRENPFTGEYELEFTARPYNNWNNRIAMECYLPNLYGRIYNNEGKIIEFVNNYEYLNFDFGPTLLNWLEITYPVYYHKLIETVKKITSKTGFSPVIAHPYNHTILPLDNFSNKITQIHWGIEDFKSRFGFHPQGMWLSECAVNEDTLRVLIDYGIKYIILSPHQISKVINLKTQKEEPVKPSSIYVWFDRNEKNRKICKRHIKIFVYDGEFSRRTSFENITFNSEIFSREISLRMDMLKTNFLLIATDGETFGHHHKFADLTLSHSFKYELSKYNIKPITLSEYLSIKEPESEVEINTMPDGDGTSWSCAHGVRRWKGGCDCGNEGIYDTSWRFGLRSAVRWLGEVTNDIYMEEGRKIFTDPLIVKNNFINVLRKKERLEDFIKQNLKEPSPENILKAKKLLQMMKYQIYSFTSCGWFFNDISRIEAQQNLKYAFKAILITEELGYKGMEKGFISLLSMSKSNFKNFGDGEKIYLNFIKPSKIDEKLIHSYLVIKTILNDLQSYENAIYIINIKTIKELSPKTFYTYSSIYNFESDTEYKLNLIIDFYTLSDIKIHISYGEENHQNDLNSYEKISISDMNFKIQLEILKLLITKEKNERLEEFENTFNLLYKIVEKNPDIVYENLEEDFNFTINQIINISTINFLKKPSNTYIEKLEKLTNLCEKINFKINYKLNNDITSLFPIFTTKLFTSNSNLNLEKTITIFKKLNLHPIVFHLENYIISHNIFPSNISYN